MSPGMVICTAGGAREHPQSSSGSQASGSSRRLSEKTTAPSGPVQGGEARMSAAEGVHLQVEESTTCGVCTHQRHVIQE